MHSTRPIIPRSGMGSMTTPVIPMSCTIWDCAGPSPPITHTIFEGHRAKRIMIRWLLLLHRYLGISVGALMVMWCVSGVIMMYVSYPELGEDVRLRHLAPMAWSGCCKISGDVLADGDPVSEFQVEMLADRAILYLRNSSRPRLIDLATGVSIDRISYGQAATVAKRYTRDAAGAPRLLGLIDDDQWTVAGDFNADRPLYRFSLDDEKRTEVYVSSVTGRALQLTTARERFWNRLGAVPHWLYF